MVAGEKKWDSIAERDLCMSVIMASHEGRVTYNWAKTHAIMESIGHAFTKDAMSQHFTKRILRDFRARHGDIIGSVPATPKKAAETLAKRKVPSAKAAKKLADDDADDADDDIKLAETPSKKIKVEKQPTRIVKKEKSSKRGQSQTANIENFEAWLKDDN